MGHLIKEHDLVVATKRTWHGLEHIREVITRENAGNCFAVEKRTAYTVTATGQVNFIPNFQALVHKDTERPITVCHDNYQVIQNEWLWEFAEKVLSHVEGVVTCAGTLANQQRAFVSIELLQPMDTPDPWLQNINVCNSFDTSSAFEFFDSSTRIVCNNTLQYSRARALRESSLIGKVAHVGDVDAALDNLLVAVDKAFAGRKRFEELLARMVDAKLAGDDMVRLAAAQLAVHRPDGILLTDPAKKGLRGMAGLFYRGKGNQGLTFYDLLNAGTEWWTHGDGAGKLQEGNADETRRFTNSEFGTAADKKVELFNVLGSLVVDPEWLNERLEEGDRRLADVNLTVGSVLDDLGVDYETFTHPDMPDDDETSSESEEE